MTETEAEKLKQYEEALQTIAALPLPYGYGYGESIAKRAIELAKQALDRVPKSG